MVGETQNGQTFGGGGGDAFIERTESVAAHERVDMEISGQHEFALCLGPVGNDAVKGRRTTKDTAVAEIKRRNIRLKKKFIQSAPTGEQTSKISIGNRRSNQEEPLNSNDFRASGNSLITPPPSSYRLPWAIIA
jgi:hypothetical protein